MLARSRSKLSALLTVLAVMAVMGSLSAGAAVQPSDDAVAQLESEDGALRFDVAENAIDFAWAGNPQLTDGLPAERTAYLTQGYIYPEGTLTESNGVNPDGSPEFPDKVLGQWSCWGWFLGSEAPAGAARWLTTHLFSIGEGWGETTLVSEGYSIDDVNVALERAIVGGTGPFAGATGIQLETNLGFNASNGINVRYEIRLADL